MPRALVVDDSGTDRQLAGGLLEKQAGWQVGFAEDGADAMARMEQDPPDLVLTDLQMPGMTGLELVSAVHDEYPLIPVILMTSKGSEEIAVEALRKGAASYVPKRTLARDLVETVQRIHASAGEERSRARLMDCMVSRETEFVIDNDLALISSLVAHLQSDLGKSECLVVASALDEALINAYYHGNLEVDSELREQDHESYYELAQSRLEQPPYSDRRIYVSARVTPEEARYVVRDDGPGFDPDSLPDPTDPANIERCHGRGLLLMRTFMDDVAYNDTGNEVTMVKSRAEVAVA